MALLDWIIVAVLFILLGVIAYTTKKYVQGVADFLAANRCAGRYLLTLADGMAGLGAIGIIATFQQNYQAGLGAAWWGGIMAPVLLLLPLTGFVIYRFRQSRVLTIAEFYERRYSRKFRVFTGVLAFLAGIINYGVFPQVTARFFISFCGIPQYFLPLPGGHEANLTLGFVMAVLLISALVITFRGGQIAIMITDFLQAQYVNVVFLILLFVLLWQFGIGEIVETLKSAPEGKSLLNPFDQGDIPDFNIIFFMIMAFNAVYGYMAWQGNQGYNASAKSPHEAKMARILGAWRYGATWTVILLIPVIAWVVMNSPAFADQAAIAQSAIDALNDDGLERQLTVPIILRQMLPIGMTGLFVAAMLAAAISTDDTYLHSWGSIYIQDVYLPLTGKVLEPEQHIRLLKKSILGVAIFVWCFGMIFPLYEYIFMYWAITGAIYVGGAGSVIIGGFYWKRGTTAGAWAGMITGSVFAVTGVFINNILWPIILPRMKEGNPNSEFLNSLPEVFWLDGTRFFFWASVAAILMYVIFSLLTKNPPDFNFDKILNRGKYAIDENPKKPVVPAASEDALLLDKRLPWYKRIIGIDHQFSKADKFISISILIWTLVWFAVFIIGTVIGVTFDTTDDQWAKYWMISQGLYIIVGIVTVFWFLWGGFKDLKEMFVLLLTLQRNPEDDGVVHEHQKESENSKEE